MSVNGIEITEIRVHALKQKNPESHLQAFASVVLNGQLRINSIRVVRGKFGPFVSWPSEFNRKEARPALFYMHPWEIDPGQPRVPDTSLRTRFRHYVNLHRTEERLTRLLGDFRWGRMDQVFGVAA